MRKEKKPHVILKIFNRNGGEGEFTKIITEENQSSYTAQLKGLPEEEKGLIIYKKDENNWFLITKSRVRFASEGIGYELFLEDVDSVGYCRESFEAYSTKFRLSDKNGHDYIVHFDKKDDFITMTQTIYFWNQR
ncbi:hypothetical protein [Chitinophaga sancti]|uniref:PH domain-containing protein n=1 Tax=Chitinophaga sancti TaxID=1004 RepID=A0A1K1SF73_9BACT|nr:hypothetical protein [Chitinophaga sancti]WQD59806.1 hypothetical protein U0033_18110 [Chitinophaga sancti]WQG88063.1 hypothetical protein SR876_24355 [Chitinophaga sancti]SFW83033.1 hypothetical protein SAMN05661012_05328 [Chitinophaga sancti]